ncbi:trehalase 1, partial [Penaeus vannamei]
MGRNRRPKESGGDKRHFSEWRKPSASASTCRDLTWIHTNRFPILSPSSPEFLDKVVDPELEQWGRKLNELWKDLGRKISDDVEQNPDKYSQIFVPNPVIVPGGRFREFYYWDSYWTIDGLLLTGMEETVKGMLENFIQMVNDYGMVPNGGRVYYTRRSQPPYLIPMVKLYMDQTNDLQFL